MSLNSAKCVFGVTSEALLGHIVSKEAIAVDPQSESNSTSTNANKSEGLEPILGANPVAQSDASVLSGFRHSVACSST